VKETLVAIAGILVGEDGDRQWSAPGGRECSYSLTAP